MALHLVKCPKVKYVTLKTHIIFVQCCMVSTHLYVAVESNFFFGFLENLFVILKNVHTCSNKKMQVSQYSDQAKHKQGALSTL